METPNTPEELLKMQKGDEPSTEGPLDFWHLVEDMMDETLPSPYQTVKAAEKLVDRLYHYHFEVISDFDSNSNKWSDRLWREDFKSLGKALKHLRLIHED